jgi:hypothetical protein
MKKADRVAEVRRIWADRPVEKRNGNAVLIFHGWLVENRPDLLAPERYGDPYQTLKSDLSGLWRDQ